MSDNIYDIKDPNKPYGMTHANGDIVKVKDPLSCCGSIEMVVRGIGSSGPHYAAARCAKCDVWIKWLPHPYSSFCKKCKSRLYYLKLHKRFVCLECMYKYFVDRFKHDPIKIANEKKKAENGEGN